MDASPASPLEAKPCVSDDPAVDIVRVSGDETILMGGHKAHHRLLRRLAGPGRRQYSLEAIERIYSVSVHGSADAKQPALLPLRRLARHREHTNCTTRPIIFVAHGPGRRKISQSLRCALQSDAEGSGSIDAILNSTIGIIFITPPHPRRLFHTSLLATGQIACCLVARNYEICHGTPSKSCQAPWALDVRRFSSALTPLLQYLQTPPTFLFVLIALTYGVLAILQHRINYTDRLQGWFLLAGIIAGVAITLPSLARPNEGLTLASPFSICITCALIYSAAVHWFWRTFISPVSTRLDRTIDQWTQERPIVEGNEHLVKIHQIA